MVLNLQEEEWLPKHNSNKKHKSLGAMVLVSLMKCCDWMIGYKHSLSLISDEAPNPQCPERNRARMQTVCKCLVLCVLFSHWSCASLPAFSGGAFAACLSKNCPPQILFPPPTLFPGAFHTKRQNKWLKRTAVCTLCTDEEQSTVALFLKQVWLPYQKGERGHANSSQPPCCSSWITVKRL